MDEDEDAEEVEFSDDESEAAWRRQQRAADPPKRRMPQSGPAYVLPTGAPAASICTALLDRSKAWITRTRWLDAFPALVDLEALSQQGLRGLATNWYGFEGSRMFRCKHVICQRTR